MKTSTLVLIFASVVLILLCFPEESDGVVFVLTHGKVKELNKHDSDRRKRRQKSRKNRNRKKRKQSRRKLKELRRWLARFPKKNKNSDNGDRIMKKMPIFTST